MRITLKILNITHPGQDFGMQTLGQDTEGKPLVRGSPPEDFNTATNIFVDVFGGFLFDVLFPGFSGDPGQVFQEWWIVRIPGTFDVEVSFLIYEEHLRRSGNHDRVDLEDAKDTIEDEVRDPESGLNKRTEEEFGANLDRDYFHFVIFSALIEFLQGLELWQVSLTGPVFTMCMCMCGGGAAGDSNLTPDSRFSFSVVIIAWRRSFCSWSSSLWVWLRQDISIWSGAVQRQ